MTLDKNTAKLLEGVGAESANVKDLARYTAKSGVFVRVRIGRSRGCISLPPKAVGVRTDRMKKDALDAYRSLVNLGNLAFIPKEMDNELSRLDNQIRRKLARYTTTDGFMPVRLYDAFKADFQKLQAEYLAQRDLIVDSWDGLTTTFAANVQTMLDGIRMPKRDRAKLYNTIMKTLPSKSFYANSFYMKMEVRAFPVESQSETLDPGIAADIDEAWQDSVVSNAVKSIATCLTTTFEAANKAIKSYVKRGAFPYKSFQGLSDLGIRIRSLNVFSNQAITEVSNILGKLDFDNQLEAEEHVEYCMAYIYDYAKSTGIDIDLSDSALSEEDLMDVLAVAKSETKMAC